MKYFTVFGERNSGTNYLRKVMLDNFDLAFTQKFGFKHWFIKDFQPRGRANTTTDNECLESLDNHQDTLFLFIVRNPFDWIESMFNKPYHIPPVEGMDISTFIRQKHVTVEPSLPPNHTEESETPWFLDEQTNSYFIEESANIVTLRNEKNNHFYKLKDKVAHFHLVKQETLFDDLVALQEEFDLQPRQGKVELKGYRKPKKCELLSRDDKGFILGNLGNAVDNVHYLPDIAEPRRSLWDCLFG